ncbi:SCP2 sterol-binding domain-containing protein [Methylocystis sp. WRRC1]|uniref:SCP2 sterol-binding domain-containing protein n=1 Tax=Methylocystis sp. WRRC1 TaxID=1732014 RepID=UPI001D15CC02|nr:SCP2 sterol-binding domain-containing protein [Methylocystis sp. WRRC1]MCC3244792.1 SCP2 sterol-binding domain-containing protein [Methylocystis sp. WRRC1]
MTRALLLPTTFDAAMLRDIAVSAGADDVGFVSIDDPALDDQRADILAAFPFARTLISFVVKMNRENIRSPARSVANLEFHHTGDECDDVARAIVKTMEAQGVRAGYPSMGFPMEATNWPDKIWVISHKPVAVAAGLGRMGVHRNVIHPKFGNFILLGTVAVDLAVAHDCAPLDFNPCLECKLCVAACPTGAIAPDGHFDFAACYTHNYREFMGGFGDFVETIAEAKNARAYRESFTDAETVSMWQSLAFGPNYKAAYCMAVCPAGEDVIGAYWSGKKDFLRKIVDPLQKKLETIYVTAGSDAETYVLRRFPHKRAKRVGQVLRPTTVDNFLASLRLIFQRNKSTGLNAVYHFVFTGTRRRQATVTIADRKIRVEDGLIGAPQLTVTADAETWIRFLRKEARLPWALLTRKIRLKGDPRLLPAFGRCFPG